jgi:hypothetical protein
VKKVRAFRPHPCLSFLLTRSSEYALVAGADESDDGCRKSTPGSADENDSDYSTASAPSPITPRSAGDEFTLHSAAASAGAGPSGLRILTASVDSGFPAAASPVIKVEDGTDLVAASYHPHYYTPAHHAIPRAFGAMPLSGSPPLASPGGVILSPDLPLGPHGAYGLSPHAYSAPAMQRRTSSSSSAASASACTTRICNLTLCADGMSPLVIPVDAMAGAAFRLRLTLPNGVPVPAFVPGLTLTAPWSHATCTTRMNSGGVCISEERDPLQLPVGATPGMPTLAYLPPSVLNQSRLLEMGKRGRALHTSLHPANLSSCRRQPDYVHAARRCRRRDASRTPLRGSAHRLRAGRRPCRRVHRTSDVGHPKRRGRM